MVVQLAVAGGWIPFHDIVFLFFHFSNCNEAPSGGEEFESTNLHMVVGYLQEAQGQWDWNWVGVLID